MTTGKRFRLCATLCALGLWVGSSLNAGITVDSVSGIWTDADLQPNGVINGLGTDTIRFGEEANWWDRQSGYRFEGAAPPAIEVDPGDHFVLGEFTHFNYPVESGTSITAAMLDVTVDLTIDGHLFEDVVFSYKFSHEETPNSGSDPRDIVSFLNNTPMSQALQVGDYSYLLNLVGFVQGGQLVDQFLTDEKAKNTAYLKAKIHKVHTPVPEPSTYILMGSLLALPMLVKRYKMKEAQNRS